MAFSPFFFIKKTPYFFAFDNKGIHAVSIAVSAAEFSCKLYGCAIAFWFVAFGRVIYFKHNTVKGLGKSFFISFCIKRIKELFDLVAVLLTDE